MAWSLTDKKRMAISIGRDNTARVAINGKVLVMWVNVGRNGKENLVICPESSPTYLTLNPRGDMVLVSL